jgi:hypothetical protein
MRDSSNNEKLCWRFRHVIEQLRSAFKRIIWRKRVISQRQEHITNMH